MFEQIQTLDPILLAAAGLVLLVVVAVAANVVVKRVLLRLVRRVATSGAIPWGDTLVRHKVFARLANVVPALIIAMGIALLPGFSEQFVTVIQNVAIGYVALMLTIALAATLRAGNEIYESFPLSRDRPLKGVVQLVQIVVYIVGAILVVAIIFEQSPLLFLSGFGAMTAVLLLVFKDTILGLVASVQLTALDMLRVGDWIEMPQSGADGDVIEVSLHTIKVQNWDKTITTIPTHRLIAESFRNWRAMSESGGRRIKRAVNIDQASIRFLETDEVDDLKRFALLAGYLGDKQRELAEAQADLGEAGSVSVNRRRLTNVGTFRAYTLAYLKAHAKINADMTLLVRQSPPGPQGLPIEIYCFTRSTDWIVYEDVQSDVFDHLIAILPEFGLRLFQNPAGSDVSRLLKRTELSS